MHSIALCQYGQLPAVCITAQDGAQAIVTLYGAHLVSWKSSDGRERIFCSTKSALDGSRAIRGGVPVIFPQFAERGTGMRHGFARVSTWRLANSGEQGALSWAALSWAAFALAPPDLDPAHGKAWPHGFALELQVALQGGRLELSLDVRNDGAEAFAFSCALHSYCLLDQLGSASIHGLQPGALQIDDKYDEIFRTIGPQLELRQPGSTLTLRQQGFPDVVVWNPGARDAAALADLDDAEYQQFVCIEPALIEPHTLVPGASWRGWHRIEATSIP